MRSSCPHRLTGLKPLTGIPTGPVRTASQMADVLCNTRHCRSSMSG
ncbi:MAG: hypothetical protein ACOYWZ_06550 [Bacillota bacterium]